jgi:hypothetical protein
MLSTFFYELSTFFLELSTFFAKLSTRFSFLLALFKILGVNMARVRTNGSQRWKSRASIAGDAYIDGVKAPRQDWEQATKAAEETYNAAVQQAIQRKSFGKGVAKAGSQKHRDRCISVGASRFTEGVSLAEDAYKKGVEPYLQVIENVSLPPRYPKGDPRNLKRVEAITKALHDKKVSG